MLRCDSTIVKGAPMRFRKKPIIVDAVEWIGINREEILEFCPLASWGSSGGVSIRRKEGGYTIVNEGDWIIRGIDGEFSVCPPDVFERNYEAVTESPWVP